MADDRAVIRDSPGRIVCGFAAREVDCWASGDRVCRFVVKPSGAVDAA